MNNATDRRRQIVKVLWAILGLNLLVAFAKIGYGLYVDAIALTADGFHSLLDGTSNVVGIIALVAAGKPPDADHPYGHRKYETFAALGIVMMLLIGCWEIGTAAVQRLLHPVIPDITPLGFGVLLATIAINVMVALYERRAARRLNSEILHSDAAHTATDVFASGLVLISFGAARFGIAWADGVAAAIIVVIILHAALRILRGTMATLADERRIPPADVERVALEESGVREAHNVRTRGAKDDIHVDLHILVDPLITIADAHRIGHRVEDRVRAKWPGVSDVVVHVEPEHPEERARERAEGGGLKAGS